MAPGFRELFQAATQRKPYDYQRRLATESCADGPKPLAINVPTGRERQLAVGDDAGAGAG